ncbi:hypothetical protein EON77_14250, partial [bacterium]
MRRTSRSCPTRSPWPPRRRRRPRARTRTPGSCRSSRRSSVRASPSTSSRTGSRAATSCTSTTWSRRRSSRPRFPQQRAREIRTAIRNFEPRIDPKTLVVDTVVQDEQRHQVSFVIQ